MKLQRSIHANFSAVAERMLDHIALVGDGQRLTYGELDRRSDGIARHLRRHGIRPGDRVGLYAQRSLEAVAALLGILKAGAAYVPFDPTYPAKLLTFVHQDCGPSLMLVQSSLLAAGRAAFWEGAAPPATDHAAHTNLPRAALPAGTAGVPPSVHELHAVYHAALDEPAGAALPEIDSEDPAYIMYTSGSTGHPKGVLIPHRGVVRLVTDNPFADMGPDQVHLQLAPLAFDASTFEIWGALLNGGRLAILSSPHPSLDEVANGIAGHGVTTLWLTAGLFHLMVDHRLDGLQPLRQLLAGGDVLSPTHVAKAQAALPDCQLINGYGPTENTTFTCCYRIPRGGSGALLPAPAAAQAPPPAPPAAAMIPASIPIGTAIAHTQVYILDDSGREVAEGQEGELFTGGAGVALGYWQRPELTAEKFVADPHDPGGKARMYRTGDRVRRRADGNIEFLGRVDRQVKLNGKRVELDEIEATLRRGPGVEDAAVVCPPGEVGSRKVHAYIKSRDPSRAGEVRAFLKQELPDYMCPATLTVLHALPLSPTGKIDRARLPPPQETAASVPAAAGNEIEATLLAIWRQILGTDAVGVDDNFFDLGGTSLQVIAVHAKIVAAMKTDISVVDLFQFPSIAALAARLLRGADSSPKAAGGGAGVVMNADERARRGQAALARARPTPRRNAR